MARADLARHCGERIRLHAVHRISEGARDFDHQTEKHATVDLNQAPERRTLVAGDHRFAVGQERLRLEAERQHQR